MSEISVSLISNSHSQSRPSNPWNAERLLAGTGWGEGDGTLRGLASS